MKYHIWIIRIAFLLAACKQSQGCHNVEKEIIDEKEKITDEGNNDESVNYVVSEDYFADAKIAKVRKRRSSTHQDSKIVAYFPDCISRELAVYSTYSSRQWAGPVSYAVYHSSWFEGVDEKTCKGGNDTIRCWIKNLPFFVSGVSPVLKAAQKCVREYADLEDGRRSPTPSYPPGLFVRESASCPDVDSVAYKQDFIDTLNGSATDLDLDSTISDFDDVISFAQDDMICLNCDCSELDSDDDENSYDFEDGTNCGECWSTRLATGTRRTSRLRRPVRTAAKRRSGLKKKQKNKKTTNPSKSSDAKKDGQKDQTNNVQQETSKGIDNVAPVFVAPSQDGTDTAMQSNQEQQLTPVFVSPVSVADSNSDPSNTKDSKTSSTEQSKSSKKQGSESTQQGSDSKTVQPVEQSGKQDTDGGSSTQDNKSRMGTSGRQTGDRQGEPNQEQEIQQSSQRSAKFVPPISSGTGGQTATSQQPRQNTQQQPNQRQTSNQDRQQQRSNTSPNQQQRRPEMQQTTNTNQGRANQRDNNGMTQTRGRQGPSGQRNGPQSMSRPSRQTGDQSQRTRPSSSNRGMSGTRNPNRRQGPAIAGRK